LDGVAARPDSSQTGVAHGVASNADSGSTGAAKGDVLQ
jgi:hypothetical protein